MVSITETVRGAVLKNFAFCLKQCGEHAGSHLNDIIPLTYLEATEEFKEHHKMFSMASGMLKYREVWDWWDLKWAVKRMRVRILEMEAAYNINFCDDIKWLTLITATLTCTGL